MKNQPTPLLQACATRGVAAHPGFEMLLQQVPEYLHFFGLHTLAQAVQRTRPKCAPCSNRGRFHPPDRSGQR